MKPLNPFAYMKRNPKKMLPVFCSIAIGVLLVYIFSLFSATTIKMVSVATFDVTNKYNIVYTKDNTALSQNFLDEVSNVRNNDAFPVQMNISGLAYYRGGMGGTTLTTFNLFDDDTAQFLDSFGIKLAVGSLPKNNQAEILVPVEYALQNDLTIGNYIGTAVSDEYALQGKYKICGLTQGEVLFSITCEPGNEHRKQIMSRGIMYSIDGLGTAEQAHLLDRLPSNVIAITSEYYQHELSGMLTSMQLLTYILTAVMIIVLCIALGNLNIVLFDSRKSEMAILYSIGFTKGKLARKMWEENMFVCLSGYVSGILLTTAIIWLLNSVSLIPNGKVLEIINAQGLAVAFALPIAVSVFSLLPSLANNVHAMKEVPY